MSPLFTNSEARAVFRSIGACREARSLLGRRAPERAWNACQRGDHMLWLCAALGVDQRRIVQAAAACAELALKHVPSGEERPRRAVEAARAWADDPSEEHRRRAAHAADAANEAALDGANSIGTVSAAGYAACAAHAVYPFPRDTFVAYAARYAARASRSYDATLARCAELVREHIPFEIVVEAARAVLRERSEES